MENQPLSSSEQNPVSKPKKNIGKLAATVFATVLVLIGTAYGVYAWQQEKVANLKNETVAANKKIEEAEAKLSKTVDAPAITPAQSVYNRQADLEQTVKAYSVAKAVGFGGTAYTLSNQKNVGDFARVNLKYKEDQGSECCSLVFRNVENKWVLITTISFLSPEGDTEREMQVQELTSRGVPRGQGLVSGW